MTDKEILIESLKKGVNHAKDKVRGEGSPFSWGDVAESLIADGWIRPPCKVGDMFYIVKSYTNSYLEIVSREVVSTLVKEILINKNEISIVTEEAEYNAEDIGNLIFLTKEEAEQALAERSGDNGN